MIDSILFCFGSWSVIDFVGRAGAYQNFTTLLGGKEDPTFSKKTTAEIQRVLQYIQEHFHEELSLKTLAEIACVSPHYFSAYFKSETGQNYKAFLTQLRMERAMHLVLDTDLKTYEIAEQVGYNNVRRFVDTFRAAYQMSPADYRKLHKR